MAKPDLKSALAQLDPKNDDHWTSDGSPAVKAVEQILASSTNRAAITDADPEFNREVARARFQDDLKKQQDANAEQAAGGEPPAEDAPETTGGTTEPASEAEQVEAADHRPEGQPEVQVSGEAVAKTLDDAATAAEATPEVETIATPGDPDTAPLDTTEVQGGGDARPAVGVGWDPGKRVTAQTAEGPASGVRPTVGVGFDRGERVAPETADGPITAEQLIDQNPGPHVPPVQADGAIPESVDPTAFQPQAATSPELQERPTHVEPTKEEIAQASDVDFGEAKDELEALNQDLADMYRYRDELNEEINQKQARRDAIVTAREVTSDSHVDATRAYFARQDAEKAEAVALRQAQRALLGNLAPDVGASQIDQAAAMAGKRGYGQQRHAPRPPSA